MSRHVKKYKMLKNIKLSRIKFYIFSVERADSNGTYFIRKEMEGVKKATGSIVDSPQSFYLSNLIFDQTRNNFLYDLRLSHLKMIVKQIVYSFLLSTIVGRRTRRKNEESNYQDQLNLLTERVLALEQEVKTLKTTNAGFHEIVEEKEAVDDIDFLLTKNEELTGRLEAVEKKIESSSATGFSTLASNVANLLMSMTHASNDTIILNTDDSIDSNSTSFYENRINALESSISSIQTFNQGLNHRMDSLKNEITHSKTDLSNEINFLAVSSSVQTGPNN